MRKPTRVIVCAMLLLAALCALFTFASFSADTAIGDADCSGGRPTVADARAILRAAAGITAVTDKAVYDVNGDGFIRVNDARNVLRVALDLPVSGITVSVNGYIMPKDGWSYSDYSAGRCTAVEYVLNSEPYDTSTISTTSAHVTTTTPTTSAHVTTTTPTTSAHVTTTVSTTSAGQININGVYTTKADVALYIHTYNRLPSNFITKTEAKALGWPGGSLEPYAPGKCIGGDYFGNYEGLLPKKNGRNYYECDIDTLRAASRGAKRLVYSNDGLIYYTADHYESFTLLYGAP